MRNRLMVAAAAVALLAGLASPAVADPPTEPNGPWPGENDSNLAGLRSYEQLWSTLENIENRAQGAFDLSPAPLASNTGREIPVVTIGDGPTPIMIVAQQHGNEYVVSEGMIEIIRSISGNSQAAKEIRDAVTATIVPRVNVDGFDADITDEDGDAPPWRQNYDPTCTEFCEFYADGRGYDINRYHSYTDNPFDHPYKPGDDNDNPVPESIAMRLLWDERQPEIVMDFHHQGSYVDDEGGLITGSTMWPNAVEEAERLGIADEFAETIELSQRVVTTMLMELEQYGFANITRYPSTSTPGIARNAYGLLGSGSVLFELRGDIGTKSSGYITKTAELAGMAVLEAITNDTLSSTPPACRIADADGSCYPIRERGDSVRDPHPENGE